MLQRRDFLPSASRRLSIAAQLLAEEIANTVERLVCLAARGGERRTGEERYCMSEHWWHDGEGQLKLAIAQIPRTVLLRADEVIE